MARRAKTARPQVGLRVSEDMRVRLEKVAKKNGRSINAEVVERLERSFETEDRFGGPRLAELIETIAAAMKLTGEHAALLADPSKLHKKGAWMVQPWPYKQARNAAEAILKRHQPRGKIVEPSPERLVFGDIWVTDLDPEELAAEMRENVKNLARLFGDDKLKKKEQTDE